MKKVITFFVIALYMTMTFMMSITTHANESSSYERINLPVISDKLSENPVIELQLLKSDGVMYVSLATASELIGANYQEVGNNTFIVCKDSMYFRYCGSDEMQLILDTDYNENTSWKNKDNILLDGQLFSCKKIDTVWYVDFIKFCDMFGVSFYKITDSVLTDIENNISQVLGENISQSINLNDIKENLNLTVYPYYIFLYSGTSLSEIYSEYCKHTDLYTWDYTRYNNKGSKWYQNAIKALENVIRVESGNVLSNFFNDDYGFTKIFNSNYISEEHYQKSLIDVTNANYNNYILQEGITDHQSWCDDLKELLNYNTILSSTTSVSDNLLEKYLNTALPKIKGMDGFTKWFGLIGSPVQAYMETCEFNERINNIDSNKMELLNKAIIENQTLNIISSTQGSFINAYEKIMGSTATTIFFNSTFSYTGLVDSSKEVVSVYKNDGKQFLNQMEKALESLAYGSGDELIQWALSTSQDPRLMTVALIQTAYDGFRAWTQQNYGESLQECESLVQYRFIQDVMLKYVDYKEVDSFYNQLLLKLQASLCCYQLDSELFKEQINSISDMITRLESIRTNRDYYHDPRNNNVDADIINEIYNYSDNLVVAIEDEAQSKEINIIDSGTCGKDLTWTLDNNGQLTIEGSGSMFDYNTPYDKTENPPWRYKKVKSLVVKSGVTTIGNGAFGWLDNLENVSIANTVTSIGVYSFFSCDRLGSLFQIPESITSIGIGAFDLCCNTHYIYAGRNIEYLDDYSINSEYCTTIYGYIGSEAQKYADRNGITFICVDDGYGYHGTINNENGASFRSYANKSSKEISIIPYGTEISEYDSIGDWALIKYNDKLGYVHKDDLLLGGFAKPVIYLYPEMEQDISVKINFKSGNFTCTYPKYNDGWNVTAYPDGTIINKYDNDEYSYLYWEGEGAIEYDFSSGFVVKNEDTIEFLKEKLSYMGLSPKEYNEFIVYWLPIMQKNKYNLISFQMENYNDSVQLEISPKPDNILRVFMAFKKANENTKIPEQQLESCQRNGFSVVEWGGTEVLT